MNPRLHVEFTSIVLSRVQRFYGYPTTTFSKTFVFKHIDPASSYTMGEEYE